MFKNEVESEIKDLENLTLSQVVSKNYKTASVFEKYNLDFCCKGKRNIADACKEAGISKEDVMNDLNNVFTENAVRDFAPDELKLNFLVDHILNTHHTYIRNMLPVINARMDKVSSKHGQNHPELKEVARIFSVLQKDLRQHMIKEEEILFPYLKKLAMIKENKSKYESPYFGSVRNPIAMMEAEHRSAGDDFHAIREVTNNFKLPEDACNGFRILYLELQEFEEDLHKHIHLENNILFPKSVQMEEEFALS